MKKMLFVVLAVTTVSVNAAVFKCQSPSGGLEYKSGSCAPLDTEQAVLAIKAKNPQQEQQARMRLQAWQERQEADKKQKLAVAKARQAEVDKKIALNAAVRTATAAEQQALATQALAGQIERQNRLNANNSLYEPQHHYDQQQQDKMYSGNQEHQLFGESHTDDLHRARHGHQGRHPRRHNEQVQHPE
ncbi:hypothetical protein [Crenothrix polyspora]|uniref:DUF4124 domain-containing protein n=1 Tax=Crenothrix polyspora TaxID=360316 RepID=A0A1R4HD55_9GAMM|nr:hypothetical protein [Crenothrix polyspora]SJM93800.1 exported hypothetical protein [Crenothrix polyspora]